MQAIITTEAKQGPALSLAPSPRSLPTSHLNQVTLLQSSVSQPLHSTWNPAPQAVPGQPGGWCWGRWWGSRSNWGPGRLLRGIRAEEAQGPRHSQPQLAGVLDITPPPPPSLLPFRFPVLSMDCEAAGEGKVQVYFFFLIFIELFSCDGSYLRQAGFLIFVAAFRTFCCSMRTQGFPGGSD